MKEGDVALAPIPQSNRAIKHRPVILLRTMPRFADFLVCGISTQSSQQVADFDEIISPADADFSASGLKSESLIRLGFLAVLPRTSIPGSIGSISSERHKRLLRALSDHLVK